MRLLGLVFLAAFASACVGDASAVPFRHRQSVALFASDAGVAVDSGAADSGVPPDSGVAPDSGYDVVTRHSWSYEYWASDVVASPGSWPEHQGDGPTLSNSGTPVLNLSTSGFTSTGLPSALIDKGVSSATSIFTNASANITGFDTTDGTLWIRVLVHYSAITTTTEYTVYLFTSGTDLFRIRRSKSGSNAGVLEYFIGAGGTDSTTSSYSALAWLLLDVQYCATCGTSGHGKATVYRNGSSVAAEDYTLANNWKTATYTALSILGETTNYSPEHEILFVGINPNGSISLAEHQTDATLLGL